MSDFASDLSGRLTEALSAATPDTSTPEPAAPAPVESAPAVTPESPAPQIEDEFEFPEETPQPEVPAQAAAPVEEDPEAQPTGIKGVMGPDGKPLNWRDLREALVKDPKGRRFYSGFQLARELEKPLDQGGLGGVPSVQQMREMHQDSADLRLMAHEFHHGDPSYAGNFIKQWFSPGPQGHSPGAQLAARSFLTTIHGMANDANQPPAYRAHAAQMYTQAALPAVMNHIDDLYQRGLGEADTQRRVLLLNVARILEEDITGKFRELPPGVDGEEFTKSRPQADPRAAELDAKLRYINDFQQNQRQQVESAFGQQFNGQITSGLDADVKAALKPLSEALAGRTYGALEARFVQEVNERVKSNPAQLRNFFIARDLAKAQRTPENTKAAVDAWRSVARPIIKQLRVEYLKDAQPQIEAASARRHATLSEASLKTGTSSVAQPVGKNLAGAPATRQQGESYNEYLQRVTRAAVSAAS